MWQAIWNISIYSEEFEDISMNRHHLILLELFTDMYIEPSLHTWQTYINHITSVIILTILHVSLCYGHAEIDAQL